MVRALPLIGFVACLMLSASYRASSVVPLPAEGELLAAVNKNEDTVWLIDAQTGNPLAKLPTGPHPQEVAFSPDGKTAVVSNMGRGQAQPGKTLTVVDVSTRKVVRQVELGAHGAPHGVEFLDSDRVLMTSHETDSLVLVNVRSGALEKVVASGGKGTHLAVISPDRTRAFAANVFSGSVSVLNLSTFKVEKTIACGARAEGISISPDGKWVAVGNVGEHTVSLIDTAKLEVVKTLTGTRTPIRTFFTSDSQRLLVSCPEAGEIAVFQVGSFEEQPRLKLGEGSRFVLKGGPAPMAMNWARGKDHLYVVILNADSVAVLNGKSLKVERVVATGRLPDGIAVARAG